MIAPLLTGLLLIALVAATPVVVRLDTVADGRCLTTIDGVQVDPHQGPALTEALKDLPRSRPVRVEPTLETSYRCIAGAIFVLQREGYLTVDVGEERLRR